MLKFGALVALLAAWRDRLDRWIARRAMSYAHRGKLARNEMLLDYSACACYDDGE